MGDALFDAIFFSPHLDDAVLSHGGTIAKLTAKGKKVLVVTLFTQGEPRPISRDGKDFLQRSEKKTVEQLFKDRKKEDKNAAKLLGFNIMHLGYKDALYRLRKPTPLNSILSRLRFMYPSYKAVFRGKIASADQKLQENIRDRMLSIINEYGKSDSEMYGPLGIHNHVDHLLVFEALFSLEVNNSFFWEDLPHYNPWQKKKRLDDLAKRKLTFRQKKVSFKKYVDHKRNAINQYTSQVPALRQHGHGLIMNNFEILYISQIQ